MRTPILTLIFLLAAAAPAPAQIKPDKAAAPRAAQQQRPRPDFNVSWSAIERRLDAEWEKAFSEKLQNKNPIERETAIKVHRKLEMAQKQAEMRRTVQRMNDLEKEIKTRINKAREFQKTLGGKTPAEREAAIKEHLEREHLEVAENLRDKLKSEITARMSARETALAKDLPIETPDERLAAMEENGILRRLDMEAVNSEELR